VFNHAHDLSANKTIEDVSSKRPYLPPTLYICGYAYRHLRPDFEESDSDLDNFLNVDYLVPRRQDQLSESNPVTPWRRYGTHHKAAATFKLAVLNGCRICTGIRDATSNLDWANLESAKVFDTGFTTYGVYNFPESTSSWVVFHLGLPYDYPGLSFDPQTPALHLLCRPNTCNKGTNPLENGQY
jgi:hypothetical protein